MFKKTSLAAGVAAFAAIMFAGGCAIADANKGGKVDYTKMSAAELADYIILASGGFRLDVAAQEGGTMQARMVQDDLQKACSVVGGGQPDAATLEAVRTAAAASITYPEGGIKLGDWQKGRDLSWSGFGFRVGHRTDEHSGNRQPGGNCANCHQKVGTRDGGTLGPDLTGYGKTRGTSDAMLKYVYDVIYNAHAYFPCTQMPRMGAKGILTQEQIADVMAWILHPESPVNQ
jgi:L-cysteine S-thiosulfotransferase